MVELNGLACRLRDHFVKNLGQCILTKLEDFFQITFDQSFNDVVKACAAPRATQPGTWITREMQLAYSRLHKLGIAHSVETWQGDQLVGGLYGVALGRVFFGESMFSRQTDASKAALAVLMQNLVKWGFDLVDCQLSSPHLIGLGAVEIPRIEFAKRLECSVPRQEAVSNWMQHGGVAEE